MADIAAITSLMPTAQNPAAISAADDDAMFGSILEQMTAASAIPAAPPSAGLKSFFSNNAALVPAFFASAGQAASMSQNFATAEIIDPIQVVAISSGDSSSVPATGVTSGAAPQVTSLPEESVSAPSLWQALPTLSARGFESQSATSSASESLKTPDEQKPVGEKPSGAAEVAATPMETTTPRVLQQIKQKLQSIASGRDTAAGPFAAPTERQTEKLLPETQSEDGGNANTASATPQPDSALQWNTVQPDVAIAAGWQTPATQQDETAVPMSETDRDLFDEIATPPLTEHSLEPATADAAIAPFAVKPEKSTKTVSENTTDTVAASADPRFVRVASRQPDSASGKPLSSATPITTAESQVSALKSDGASSETAQSVAYQPAGESIPAQPAAAPSVPTGSEPSVAPRATKSATTQTFVAQSDADAPQLNSGAPQFDGPAITTEAVRNSGDYTRKTDTAGSDETPADEKPGTEKQDVPGPKNHTTASQENTQPQPGAVAAASLLQTPLQAANETVEAPKNLAASAEGAATLPRKPSVANDGNTRTASNRATGLGDQDRSRDTQPSSTGTDEKATGADRFGDTTGTQSAAQKPETFVQQLHAETARTDNPAKPAHLPDNAAAQQQPNITAGTEQPKFAAEIQVRPQQHTADSTVSLDKLGMSIAARSNDGQHEFEIRLDPAELGRVHIKLTVDDDGQTKASVVADKPQTLELLQRDSSNLNRALQDAGLSLANNGLNFSLREQNRETAKNGQGKSRNLSADAVLSTSSAQSTSTKTSYAPNSVRLDISV